MWSLTAEWSASSQSCPLTAVVPLVTLAWRGAGRTDVQARPSSPLLLHPHPPFDPNYPEDMQLQQQQSHHQQQQHLTGIQEWQVPNSIRNAEIAVGVGSDVEGANGSAPGPGDNVGGETGAEILGDAAPDVACSNSHVAEMETYSGKLPLLVMCCFASGLLCKCRNAMSAPVNAFMWKQINVLVQ